MRNYFLITLVTAILMIHGAATAQEYPILVLADKAYFGQYVGELLKAEGLNEFTLSTSVEKKWSAVDLAKFAVVMVTKHGWTSQNIKPLYTYVQQGGKLILIAPEERLSDLAGLLPTKERSHDAYLRMEGSHPITTGIAPESMQYHGEAAYFNRKRAIPIAMFWSDAKTATAYPAITENGVGKGKVYSFLYNLPESVVSMHQGNKAWAGQERDGMNGLRQMDMFVGMGNEPNWIDKNKVHMPQADEQIRILTHMIEAPLSSSVPLPRFWYFPDQLKALTIMTCDGENSGAKDFYEANINTELELIKAKGGSMSVYLIGTGIPAATVNRWRSDGHEVAIHFDNTSNAAKLTHDNMTQVYDASITAFHQAYGKHAFQGSTTVRNHWITWVGWADQAAIEAAHGIGLDLNLYKFDNDVSISRRGWTGGPGFYTGSGLPMRFVSDNGEPMDIYEAETQVIDEQLGKDGLIFSTYKTLLDRSLDQENYAVITANFHPNNQAGIPYFDELIRVCDYSNARQVPIWSAERLLHFIRTRDQAVFASTTWKDRRLSFTIKSDMAGEKLSVLIPLHHEGKSVGKILIGRQEVAWQPQRIKGIDYAWFSISSGSIYPVEVFFDQK